VLRFKNKGVNSQIQKTGAKSQFRYKARVKMQEPVKLNDPQLEMRGKTKVTLRQGDIRYAHILSVITEGQSNN